MPPNISGAFKKTDYNTRNIDIEKKVASVTGLVTTTALNVKVIER